MGVEEFGFEILKVVVIERELSFERPVGHLAALLHERGNLVDDLIEVHQHPSTHSPLFLR